MYIELGDIETYSLDVVSIGHVLYLSSQDERLPLSWLKGDLKMA